MTRNPFLARAAVLLTLAAPLFATSTRAAPLNFVVDRFDDVVVNTCVVPTLNDCSLRGAVIAANQHAGLDNITFLVSGTYTLSLTGSGEDQAATGDLDLTDTVTFYNVSGGPVIIDAGGVGGLGDRVFDVQAGATVVFFSPVTVRGGYLSGATEGGAGIRNAGTLTMNNGTVTGNVAAGSLSTGGGVLNTSNLTMAGGAVTDNSAQGGGDGGGIYSTSTASLGSVDLSNNHADARGGAIASVGGSAVLLVASSTLDHNDAQSGGAVWGEGGVTIGAVTTFDSNSATDLGGAVYTATQNAALSDVSLTNNEATAGGGGVEVPLGASVTMAKATFDHNTTSGNGGGLENLGNLVVVSSTFSSNSATSGGGGIENDGVAGLTSVTMNGNSAASGGALRTGGTSTTQLANLTMSANTASDASGAMAVASGTVGIVNTILAGSCVKQSGSLFSLGANIESPGNTCGFNQASDQTTVTAAALGLGPLLHYGSTLKTQIVLLTSVAIDKALNANCYEYDGRGFHDRNPPGDSNFDGNAVCEIGAHEEAPVFGDGLESGDLTKWSSVSP